MRLEGYSELTELAQGGMAQVYKARQVSLDRTVAIKFLSAEYLWDDEAKLMFDQESLVIAHLNHPNIIHIIDRGLTEKGRPFFVMEYVQGDDLSQLVRRQKLSIQKKFDLLVQICKGMACAHKNGVIHRDIKPTNILIDTEGHVRILDFGIAWLAASGRPENIVGTPDYMSPEQFKAPETVTHLSDIYSFAVIMYELFMGELPTAHLDDLAGSMSKLPPPLAQLIEQCLQTEMTERPASADDVRLRLLKIMQGTHISKHQQAEANAIVNAAKDKFSLLDIIKQDDFGAVYLFEDKTKHSLLVIKKRINTTAGYKEARLLSHLTHENIIRILGSSKNENTFIVVMEHLTGGSLQDRLSRPYSLEKFKTIATSLCDAMQYAHIHNITHGNLRPANILFDADNKIKITDFGFDEHYTSNKQEHDWYQADSTCTDPVKRDIYSAGAIFYHMLTGEPVKLDRGRIQADLLFNNLGSSLRNFLCNIMESDSNSQYTSFEQITSDIEKLRPVNNTKQIKKIKAAKQSLFGIGDLILIFILISLTGLGVYFFFNPQQFDIVINLLGKPPPWFERLM